MPTTVRIAGCEDIDELIRLRKIMMQSMNSPGVDDPRWQQAAAVLLHRELSQPKTAATTAFVIDGDDGLAACAAGSVQQRLPGPNNPSGLTGYVSNVCTDPAFRRLGYARACMSGLLEWFAGRGAHRVDLRTSAAAEGMYQSLGFTRTAEPSMVLR